MKKFIPIVPFLEKFHYVERPAQYPEDRFPNSPYVPLILEPHQKEILDFMFTPNASGRLPFRNYYYSTIKKCLAPEERLWLTDGRFVEAASLVGEQFRVWSYDGRGFVEADASAESAGALPMYRIRTLLGRRLLRTAEHPLLTWRGWVPVEELRVGDGFALPDQVPGPSQPVDCGSDIARFLGYMISEGGLGRASTPSFTQNPGPLCDDMHRVCANLGFGLTPQKGTDNQYSVTGCVDFMRSLDLLRRNSYTVFVPDIVFRSPNHRVAEFLGCLYGGDGWACHSNGHSEIGYGTMSQCLAQDVCALLQRFGLYPNLQVKKSAGRHADHSFQLTLGSSVEVEKFSTTIKIVGKEHRQDALSALAATRQIYRAPRCEVLPREAWDDIIAAKGDSGESWARLGLKGSPVRTTWAPTRTKIADLATRLGANDVAAKALAPLLWDEVVEIEFLGEQSAISVTVPGYENFLTHAEEHNSGKSEIAAGVGEWAMFSGIAEPAGFGVVVANKKEQAADNIYAALCRSLNKGPLHIQCEEILDRHILSKLGFRVKPIPADFAGEAGSNPVFSLFDEVWGFGGLESFNRLWAEFTPVLTRKNSFRFIASYVGYEQQGDLLLEIFNRVVRDGKRVHKTLPIYVNGSECFYYDSGETARRMPWQKGPEAEEYYKNEKKTLRSSDYRRLHLNYWSTGAESLDMKTWDACAALATQFNYVVPMHDRSMILGVGIDAAYSKDRSAVCTVFKRQNLRFRGPCMIFENTGEDADFEETVEKYLIELRKHFRIGPVVFDPSQFIRSAAALRKKGFKMVKWDQTPANRAYMGGLLMDLLRYQRLVLAPEDARDDAYGSLRSDASRCVVKPDKKGGVVIGKERKGAWNDGIISLAQACVAAESLPDFGSITDQLLILG